jgi:hypothetical protein
MDRLLLEHGTGTHHDRAVVLRATGLRLPGHDATSLRFAIVTVACDGVCTLIRRTSERIAWATSYTSPPSPFEVSGVEYVASRSASPIRAAAPVRSQ